MQAQLSQQNEYIVTGESVNLADQEAQETDFPVNPDDPYILNEELSEDLDLSFDLSSGL